jgi:hypothetical protein
MLQIITLIILAFGLQPISVDKESVDENFALIEDFEKNRKVFRADTFDLAGQSTEGGELIAFHSNERDYLVFDIWLFGEMGKIHAIYWTDRNLNFRIIKRVDFKYDKPFYEEGYKVTETTEYLSYSDTSVRLYNRAKTELENGRANGQKMKWENFFNEITKDLKIVK